MVSRGVGSLNPQRDPVVVYWPSGFLEAGAKEKKTHLSRKILVFGLAARPPRLAFSCNVWFFGLGTPGFQKNTWPINH